MIAWAEDDRHHFCFIISPKDADQLSDLKAFTRDLMGQMEKDLDTGQPHVLIVMRGVRQDGQVEMAAGF